MLKKYMLIAMVLGLISGTVATAIDDDSVGDLTTVDQALVDESCVENKESESSNSVFFIDAKVTRRDPQLLAMDFMTSSLTVSKSGECSYFCKVTLPGYLLLEFTISSENAPVDLFTAESTYDQVVYAINFLRGSVTKFLEDRQIEQVPDEYLGAIEQEVKRYAQQICNQLVVEHEEQQAVVDTVITLIKAFFQRT